MYFLSFWEYLRVTLCRHRITDNRIVKRVVESTHGPFSPRHHRISATQLVIGTSEHGLTVRRVYPSNHRIRTTALIIGGCCFIYLLRAFNFLMSLPLTTLKSLISSLNSVIPESDRISPSYSGSAFGRFVVDVLYSIVLLID